MANFTIMRSGLNTEIVGDLRIGQSSEDVTVGVTDDGTYQEYDKKLYYSYCYHNKVHRALCDVNSNSEHIIPVQAFLEPGTVKLSLELSNGTNKPTCNACFIKVTKGAKSVAASDILPDEETWQSYIQSYIKSNADTLKGTGFSTEVINKLEEVGNYLAYTTSDGGSKWKELISILRGSSGGGSGETEIKLSSISATYTGGEVAVGTALTSLTGITVTATYSDGSTTDVTDYTLSGTIAEGSNTITVSYGGKTTTITVTGVAGGSVKSNIEYLPVAYQGSEYWAYFPKVVAGDVYYIKYNISQYPVLRDFSPWTNVSASQTTWTYEKYNNDYYKITFVKDYGDIGLRNNSSWVNLEYSTVKYSKNAVPVE